MKKLLILSAILILISCKDDKSELEPQQVVQERPMTQLEKSLVGKWIWQKTESYYNGGTLWGTLVADTTKEFIDLQSSISHGSGSGVYSNQTQQRYNERFGKGLGQQGQWYIEEDTLKTKIICTTYPQYLANSWINTITDSTLIIDQYPGTVKNGYKMFYKKQ